MIHYSCDRCKRQIDVEQEARYEVRIEIKTISAGGDSLDTDEQAARDLLELEDIINELDDGELTDASPSGQAQSFDLCRDCYARFLVDPLAQSQSAELGFSEN